MDIYRRLVRGTRPSVLAAAAIALLAGFAVLGPGLAQAQTVTYGSTGSLFVGDDNEPEGDTSTINVPAGTGPVQSVEVTNLRIFWPASGQELSLQLIGPGGQSLHLFTEGCFSYQDVDIWTYRDGAAQVGPNDKDDAKCDLPGGTFRPADPQNRKLSIFAGKPASGTWTLRAGDFGFIGNQGSIQSWAVRINHVPAPPTASPAFALPPAAGAGAGKKCKKGRKLKKGKCVKKKKKKN